MGVVGRGHAPMRDDFSPNALFMIAWIFFGFIFVRNLFVGVIAESFAPIFYNNCIRNGIAPIALPRTVIGTLAGGAATVDLAAQTVNGHAFDIEAEAKMMLLEGLDAIDLTLKHRDATAAWQARDRAARPWIYLEKHP
jgi:3-isopropylmalate/(R)-2-methylmalate dehydratase small subunit